jgi:hypothetical protein
MSNTQLILGRDIDVQDTIQVAFCDIRRCGGKQQEYTCGERYASVKLYI